MLRSGLVMDPPSCPAAAWGTPFTSFREPWAPTQDISLHAGRLDSFFTIKPAVPGANKKEPAAKAKAGGKGAGKGAGKPGAKKGGVKGGVSKKR